MKTTTALWRKYLRQILGSFNRVHGHLSALLFPPGFTTTGVVLFLTVLFAALVAGCSSSPPASSPSTSPLTHTFVSPLSDAAAQFATSCSLAGEEPAAVDALLADLALSADKLLSWYCRGAGLGDIRKAHQVADQIDAPVEDVLARFFDGVGWGDIVENGLATEAGAADANLEEARCLDEHGGHPEVRRIAESVKFDPADIASLFCRGLGFGEIRNAYQVHAETDAPLQEIATLFLQGQNWAEIRAELGAAPLAGDPTGND